MQQRLTQVLDFQANALQLRSERQRLIASNIANADTPGYQAREMDFARALREATGSQAVTGEMATTQAGHMAPIAGARDEAELLYASHSQDSVDRNTVDLERERHSAVDNAVKYEATLRFINSSVRNVLDAMKSPNQG
ncbi:MAG: flagellar basal body rod protein FlgB [Ideonella sp.]|jgi:flagellar basal-body rod protein FlgB|nr:flagellar basal body rod protein FlgB [Ideonella sp.]MBL0148782.1 flagellar basal body rod protein FlgB [Ideonella sp.]